MKVDEVAFLLLGLAVIVVVARLLGTLAQKLGQPRVIGEILGGVMLGPTLFGGELTRTVFPADVRPALSLIATVGVAVFMFLVGLHLDDALPRGAGRVAATVSVSSVILPFGLGALLALHLLSRHPSDNRLAFVLFLGTAMAVTAFPVLARILADKGLIDTPIGGVALACAAVDDVLAWSMLAVVAAVAGDGGDLWRVLLVVPFAILLLRFLRPLLARLAAQRSGDSRLAVIGVGLAVAVGLFLSAQATEWMGLHQIFGAFLFGVTMPRQGAVSLRRIALPWIDRASAWVLLPVFFSAAGMKVDLSRTDGTGLGELALILLVAIGGKFGGAFLGARATGIQPRHATLLAILLNTRGLTELIALTIGLQLGVLDQSLYSLMVVMTLVTTAMTGPLLRYVYPPERVRRDTAAHNLEKESAS